MSSTPAEVIQKDNSKCPMLSAGTINIVNFYDFKQACMGYFENANPPIAEEARVQKIWWAFKDPGVISWLAAHSERLRSMTFEAFLGELRDSWLDKDWEHNQRVELLNFRQGNKTFNDFAYEFLRKRAYLEDMESRFDETRTRQTLEANMNPALARESNDPAIRGLPNLHQWMSAVKKLDDKRRDRLAEFTAIQAASSRVRSTGNMQGITTNANRSATSTVTGEARGPPKLTEKERRLLNDNQGCYRCRNFFVSHRSADKVCSFPKREGYVERSQADVDRARRVLNNNMATNNAINSAANANTARVSIRPNNYNQGTRTAAAVINEAQNDNHVDGNDDDYLLAAAAVIESAVVDTESDWEDAMCTPFSCPPLWWECICSSPSESLTITGLLDNGSSPVLISEELARRFSLKRRRLNKPFTCKPAFSNATTTQELTEYIILRASSLDSRFSSLPFRAIISASLVADIVFGLPFLSLNGLVIDHGAQSCIVQLDNESCYNLLKPSAHIPAKPRPTKHVFTPKSECLRQQRANFKHVRDVVLGQELCDVFRKVEKGRGKAKVTRNSPVVVAAAIQRRVADLAFLERLRRLNAATKKKYENLFPEDIPPTCRLPSDVYHRFHLTDAVQTINCREYSCPKKYKEAWRTLLDQHLAAGRIRPSSSEYASPSFLVPKADPNAMPRWVNDYRLLNGITVPDRYPLPLISDILGDCAKGKIWGKIDMTNAFFQTKVHPDDIKFTAVRTPFGLFEWTVMPQGCRNAPSTHQRCMASALRPYIGKICHAYLDDIIIWSDSVEEHIKNVETILSALRDASLFCSAKKTDLFCTEIDFLGHHISARGIEVNAAKAEKIMNWPTPRTTGDVRRFLGLVRYLAVFLPNLADQTAILTPLTGKANSKDVVVWKGEHDLAFRKIKELIASRDCLTTINHEKPGENKIFVTTDASNLGTGAVLSFGPSWESARPVAYESKQYAPAQKNYATHEQEMLAIVRALNKWRTDLLGSRFEVYTDHRTLEYFSRQRNLSKRQLRWQELLADFDFSIHYIRGEDNTVADALSRTFPDDPNCSLFAAAILKVQPDEFLTKRIVAGYKDDKWCSKLLENKADVPGLSCRNGLLFLGERLVVPRVTEVREWIFQLAHDSLGHFGSTKSYHALRDSFYWPNMRTDLESAYVPGCTDCQRNKSPTHAPHGPLHPLPIPDDRFSSVAIDFVGPLPEDEGYDFLCTMTGRLGEDVRLVPCKSNMTAEQFASIFFDAWFCNNGLPNDIVSDRDKLFVSRFWKAFVSLTGIKLRMSTAFHPQTDGASERTNKTVVQALRYVVGDRQQGWVAALPRIRFALMNTVNASTGFSGFQLSHGRSPRLIPALIPQQDGTDSLKAAKETLDRLNDDVNQAKDSLLAAKVSQAHYANRSRAQEVVFKVGDKVLLSTSNRRKELLHSDPTRTAKLLPRFDGPYTVLRAHPESSSYTLAVPGNVNSCKTFHASLLRGFVDNNTELFPSRKLARPAPVLNEDTGVEECVVDRIVDERRRGRGLQYRVRYVGYGPDEDEWLSRRECEDLEALDKWLASKRPDC